MGTFLLRLSPGGGTEYTAVLEAAAERIESSNLSLGTTLIKGDNNAIVNFTGDIMSRTFKDKPSKFKHEAWDIDWIWVEGYGHRNAPTKKTKKRKEVDTEDRWMSTPGWWVRLMMNKPQRREVHLWERKALFSDLEELVQPTRKVGHVYYW